MSLSEYARRLLRWASDQQRYAAEIKADPGYQAYHAQVVEACAKLMGEPVRGFFQGCDYLDEFLEGEDPTDTAYGQWECLD